MILHRFCSQGEFDAFQRGETLVNNINHGEQRGYDVSTGIGFCFFPEDPEQAIHRLCGIVDLDVCITLEAPNDLMRLCHGRYPNWIKPGVREGSAWLTEFCTTSYDNKRFKLIDHTNKYSTYAPNASVLREMFPNLFL